jgi:hypothetical protein
MLTFARRHINGTIVLLGLACMAAAAVWLVLLGRLLTSGMIPQNTPFGLRTAWLLSNTLGAEAASVILIGVVVIGGAILAVGILRQADAARNEPCRFRRSSDVSSPVNPPAHNPDCPS